MWGQSLLKKTSMVLNGIWPSTWAKWTNYVWINSKYVFVMWHNMYVCVWDIRQLMQLAALLLVGGLEFLMLHSEPLLLQHDLLVQTGREDTASWLYEPTDWKCMSEWAQPSPKHNGNITFLILVTVIVSMPTCLPVALLSCLMEQWLKVTEMKSYSCSSVMSFSLLSSSSLRLLICFWWASRWEWICFSTASWTHTKCTQSTYNSSDRIHHRNTVN